MTQDIISTKFGEIPLKEIIIPVIPQVPNFPIDFQKNFVKSQKENKFQTNIKITEENDYFSFKLKGRITKIPKLMDPRLAYFIGYFAGDGGLKNIQKSYKQSKQFDYKIKIADEFQIQIKHIQELYFKLFGLSPPIRLERIEKSEHTFYIEQSNKILYCFLSNVFEFPQGKKHYQLKIPTLIKKSPLIIKQWYLRGLFDADGDTRAVEVGFNSQSRIKLRMKPYKFISEVKNLLQESYKVSVNGPYKDGHKWQSSYIQIERQRDIIKLAELNFFLHPIKRWRLERTEEQLLRNKNLNIVGLDSIVLRQ